MKIAAAELWRKYSENYKSHQARYPNPKSKYRGRRGGCSHTPEGADGNWEDLDPGQSHDDSQDQEDSLPPKENHQDIDSEAASPTQTREVMASTTGTPSSSVESKHDPEESRASGATSGTRKVSSRENSPGGDHPEDRNTGSLAIDVPEVITGDDQTPKEFEYQRTRSSSLVSFGSRARSFSSVSLMSDRTRTESNVSMLSDPECFGSGHIQTNGHDSVGSQEAHSKVESDKSEYHDISSTEVTGPDDKATLQLPREQSGKADNDLSPGYPTRERSQSCIEIGTHAMLQSRLQAPSIPQHGLPVSLGSPAMLPGVHGMVLQPDGNVFIQTMVAGYHGLHELPAIYATTSSATLTSTPTSSSSTSAPVTPSSSVASTPTPDQNRKSLIFKPSEYKKSERGLSFLFPSLADQQLSLLDKVRITVLRHKHNYFLGWSEETLQQLDALVRPKMMVTRQLYKEYCHRNAMKYDSNLQFALESTEPWADEFRSRLTRPPSEGGFHSLCEVKQEAGRLWREFSGRYKMHNVVKSQMDLNSEVTAVYLTGDLREDFSSRAKHKAGDSGDGLLEPPKGRPRAISDLTDDRNASLRARHKASLIDGSSVSSRMEFPHDSVSCTSTLGSSYSRCRSPSPLSVSVMDDQQVTRRGSFLASDEGVTQTRSANSSPSPSSRSALSSPGIQGSPYITTVAPGLTVMSRSANSSPLTVGLIHPSARYNPLSVPYSQTLQRPAPVSASAETDSAIQQNTMPSNSAFRLEQPGTNRKRSFEMSAITGACKTEEDSSPARPKASRVMDSDSKSHEMLDMSRKEEDLPRSSDTEANGQSQRRLFSSLGHTSDSSRMSLYDSPQAEHHTGGSSKMMKVSKFSGMSRDLQHPHPDTHSDVESKGADREDAIDTLFKPMPSEFSVAEQLHVWLQRHRHNYFLGYTMEQLCQVEPHLRPQYVVTPDVYRRFISESMVSMFDKVSQILQSESAWASPYQSRVDKAPSDGGFTSIEEALSEALDLCNTYIELNKDADGKEQLVSGMPARWRHKKEKAMGRSGTPERGLRVERSGPGQRASMPEVRLEVNEGLMARERSSSWPQDPQFLYQRSSQRSQTSPLVQTLPESQGSQDPGEQDYQPAESSTRLRTTPPSIRVPPEKRDILKEEPEEITPETEKDDLPLQFYRKPHRHGYKLHVPPPKTTITPPSQDRDLNIEVLDLRCSTTDDLAASSTCVEGRSRSAAHLSEQLWACREMLQGMLSEDASMSWHTRLAPYMSRLQARLGEGYMCPASASDCMVDMMLAILDKELSHL